MPAGVLDLKRTFLHFTPAHDIERYEADSKFWEDVISRRLRLDGRLVGCISLSAGPIDHWERHPDGDEFLLLLRGSLTIRLEEPTGCGEHALKAGEAFVVPKGIWHTFIVQEASELIFATAGEHTEHRPSV